MPLNPDEVGLAQKRHEFVTRLVRELKHQPLAITSWQWLQPMVSLEMLLRLHMTSVPDKALLRYIEESHADDLRECEMTIEQIEIAE